MHAQNEKDEAKTEPRTKGTRIAAVAAVAEMPSPSDRHARIAQAAYYAAERRGFAPGHEVADWLAAEHEILTNVSHKD